MEELRPCTAMMWILSSALLDPEERPLAHSTQLGRARQGVLGREDKVGDEPRVLVDFNPGQPLLSAGGVQIGTRVGKVVTLWGKEYLVRRPWWRSRLHADVVCGERTVLTVRETSRPNVTVRRYAVGIAAGMDPVVALALVVLLARPDRMGVLGELTG